MALFQISNDKITIQVDSMGAELKSLKDVATGREYMWHADPQYWKRTSPVLFPLVGGLKDGVYRLGGQEYPMGQHLPHPVPLRGKRQRQEIPHQGTDLLHDPARLRQGHGI